MEPPTQFRELIEREEVLSAMGGYDALSVYLIEQIGGEVVYMSGSSVSTGTHAYPDVGLTTMSEMVTRARRMANAVDVPVFCDSDTGYGNPIDVMRTVEEYKSAGAAGIHIEDRTFPTNCGHFDDKDVVPTEEMVQKIRAATDAREDADFQIVAQTDARAVRGFEDAVERSGAYLDAGADVLFFEAPTSEAELRRVGAEFEGVLLVANMTESGETPLFSAAEFDEMRFDVVLFPATGFKTAAPPIRDVYREIHETGTQAGAMDELVSWEGRNGITSLNEIVDLKQSYATE